MLADGHRGAALREYMRDYNHWAVLGALCELLPLPENRVTLADETDAYGMPIARFDYTPVRERPREHRRSPSRRCTTSGSRPGAQDVLTIDRYAHLVGGCRMGTAPGGRASSTPTTACGASPNLFVADGSVMPTQGSANPALTIMALASRLAERLAGGHVAAAAAGRRGEVHA